MIRRLLSRIRYSAPVGWLLGLRYRLADFWFLRDKENLLFFSLFAVAISLIGGMVYFVYVDHLRVRWAQQRQEDLMCLARNVYHEARGEPMAGQYAVAEVTMNRVASRHFPDTVCEVVYEKRLDTGRNRLVGAFSWTELDSIESPRGIQWDRARRAALAIYDEQHEPTVPDALFYHSDRIEPRWATEKRRITKIGRHIFYE
ncbi:MAG: cell wall hydrolase [Woeseiaceae bacterium]|nr:cell wall hydrolase [Woeseiaceae bacterium]